MNSIINTFDNWGVWISLLNCFTKMSLLSEYIDFSIRYRAWASENASGVENKEEKAKLWEQHKIVIARNIIKGFLENRIMRCEDCRTTRYALCEGENQLFYMADTCHNKISPFKHICLNGCSFSIKCSNCNRTFRHSPQESDDDIGWNPIEGKNSITTECCHCGTVNRRDLV